MHLGKSTISPQVLHWCLSDSFENGMSILSCSPWYSKFWIYPFLPHFLLKTWHPWLIQTEVPFTFTFSNENKITKYDENLWIDRNYKSIQLYKPEQTLPGNCVLCDMSVKPSLQLQVYVPFKLKHSEWSEQSWYLASIHSSKSATERTQCKTESPALK